MENYKLQELTSSELEMTEGGMWPIFIAGYVAGYGICYIIDNYY